MTESELKLGKALQSDHSEVYEQMKSMKNNISECQKKSFTVTSSKEDFEDFKQKLLNLCDEYTESQRLKLNKRFKEI